MKNYFWIVLLGFSVLTSCQQDSAESGKSGTLPSGFDYQIHTSGNGSVAEEGQYVYYHVQLRYQGEVRQSSRLDASQPFFKVTPPPTDSVALLSPNPIQDVLRKMSEGDSATIDVPGDKLPPNTRLTPQDTLYYDVVVTDIIEEEDFKVRRDAELAKRKEKMEEAQAEKVEVAEKTEQIVKDYASGKLNSQLEETETGLKYLVMEQGDGPAINPGDFISVNYYGVLTDGTMFDNSYKVGNPFTFPIGQGRVIAGWDEGIAKFNQGGKGYLFVPSELGYGANPAGKIPANSELIFYVSIENVRVGANNPSR